LVQLDLYNVFKKALDEKSSSCKKKAVWTSTAGSLGMWVVVGNCYKGDRGTPTALYTSQIHAIALPEARTSGLKGRAFAWQVYIDRTKSTEFGNTPGYCEK
jgi:hypothetical protein